MKYEEYEKIVTELTTATDGKEAIATDLLKALKEDDAKRLADLNELTELTSKIDKLNEANSKLFLSLTGAEEKEGDPENDEKSPRERFNELYDAKYYGDKK